MTTTASTINTNRASDNVQESFVNMFVEKHFLSKMYSSCECVHDADRQCAGIDYIADGLYLDLKAQSSKAYLNNPRNTFLLEISFLSRNNIDTVGWFINPTLSTNAYAFIWIPDAVVNESGRLSSSEAINKIEIMIVDKNKLKQFVNTYCDDSDMLDLADRMRYQDCRYYYINNCPGMHFTYTSTLGEKPVNLIVNKSLLKKFSIKHCMVTKDYIKNIA